MTGALLGWSAVNVVEQATGAAVSKTTFDYDWAGDYLTGTPQPAIRHDDTNYGIGFVAAINLSYRAFGATKAMSYGDGKSLTTAYDDRLRPTTWNVWNVLGYNYNYDYLNEHTGRVTYAQNIASVRDSLLQK